MFLIETQKLTAKLKYAFNELSKDRGVGYNLFFVWPVFSQNLIYTLQKAGAEKISPNQYRVMCTQNDVSFYRTRKLFGSDFVVNVLEGDQYGVVNGVINKTNWRDIGKAKLALREVGLNNVSITPTSLYNFLLNTHNYEGFLLKEYRAGAPKLQSYFKDDHVDVNQRIVLEKLENDWAYGIRPYQATLKEPSKSVEIRFYSQGFISMAVLPKSFGVVTKLISHMFKDHQKALNKVSEAGRERLKTPSVNLVRHKNLILRLEDYDTASNGKSQSALSYDEDRLNSLLLYLSEFAEIYGKRIEGRSLVFNLLYEKTPESDEVNPTFSVDITPKRVLVSPTGPVNKENLIHLYYGIERFYNVTSKSDVN